MTSSQLDSMALQACPFAPHVLQGFAAIADEAAQALDQVAAFLSGHIPAEVGA